MCAVVNNKYNIMKRNHRLISNYCPTIPTLLVRLQVHCVASASSPPLDRLRSMHRTGLRILGEVFLCLVCDCMSLHSTAMHYSLYINQQYHKMVYKSLLYNLIFALHMHLICNNCNLYCIVQVM